MTEAQREKNRIYQRQWRKDNPEKVRAIARRYREKTTAINGRFLCLECGQRFYHEAAESGGFRKIGRRTGICRECLWRCVGADPSIYAFWKRLGIEDPLLQWASDDRIRPEEIPHAASTSLWMTFPETKLRELM